MGISFFPRGGSAQVVRYLAAALPAVRWHPTILTGSLGPAGSESNANTFYKGLDVASADFTAVWEGARHGHDPMRAAVPMHPSFEDRAGAPDRICTSLSDDEARLQVDLWDRMLHENGMGAVDLFHLHHLTAQHEAVAVACPDRPVIAHLHGTELKMLDGIRVRRTLLGQLGETWASATEGLLGERMAQAELTPSERDLLDTTRWTEWRHADEWERRLVAWAHRARHVVCISDHDRGEAERLLRLEPDKITVIPNGVDVNRFADLHLPSGERHRRWRHWLVEDPLGWDRSGEPGSLRCTPREFARFFPDPSDAGVPPVLLFVGRFLAFKRVPLLIRAYARARAEHPEMMSPLVIWGGNPGEWEGDHPADVVRDQGVDGVFFVGWRGHDELPVGINCADVMAAPSVGEPFGQVYLEAMACARPVIATDTGGPLSFVNTVPSNPNGWMVPADDEVALAHALFEAATDRDARATRGANAGEQIRSRYAWAGIASRVADLYETVM